MLENIKSFITERQGENNVVNDLAYICQGGSHSCGTNDIHSDFDFRGIILNENSFFGLHPFSHTKLVSGENGINSLNDLDIELFSISEFFKKAYKGDVIPFEMLFVDSKFHLLKVPIFQEVLDNREIFLSRSIIYNYLGMIKSAKHQIFQGIEKAKKEDRIERIAKYGFETKQAMKVVQYYRLWIEFLTKGEINLYRSDREDLLAIKNGKYNKDEITKLMDEGEKELESLLEISTLPKKPDFDKVNTFCMNYQKNVIKKFL